MKLSALLEKLEFECLQGSPEVEVTDVAYDTRKLTPGAVFVCIKGAKLDSHTLVRQAKANGAVAFVVEDPIEVEDATVVRVKDSRKALSYMAAAYYDYPAEKMVTIGITGSKGKTTASYMMKSILSAKGDKVGVIGSIGAMIGDEKQKTINTTPESYEVQRIFHEMVEAGCKYVVMEVSSQGLMLERTAGVTFDYGIFLNISRDHISPWEHKTLEEYLYCKSLLFSQCKVGIINRDDEKYDEILKNHTCQVESFGYSANADVRICDYHIVGRPGYMGIAYDLQGAVEGHVEAGSPGKFSSYDSAAGAIVAKHLGFTDEEICNALQEVKIRGRVETVDIPAPYTVILDFAHNGIGVENLVRAVKEYSPHQVIAVFGSDGNRTKIRRADAGEVLGNMADYTIVTSNCPRFESLEEINAEIQVGLDRTDGKYEIIPDRRTAIKAAMKMAQPNDMVLLIGKGHWDYEEINGVKYPFDERVVVTELYHELEAEKA